MSWMDSWSRPSKSQAVPIPYYLLPGGEATPYCRSCGRVIGGRKKQSAADAATELKYCSARCRAHKVGKLDREIEAAFVKFLLAEESIDDDGGGGNNSSSKKKNTKKNRLAATKKPKGDSRILVKCSVVEEYVFGGASGAAADDDNDGTTLTKVLTASSTEPELDPTTGSASEHEPDEPHEPETLEQLQGHDAPTPAAADGHTVAALAVPSGTRVRPAQAVSEVNGSVGGEKGWAERTLETPEMLAKRRDGERRARQREMVKCAARRGVVFGFAVGGDGGSGAPQKCEAVMGGRVMGGKVVEPSFAKGDWAVRWRE